MVPEHYRASLAASAAALHFGVPNVYLTYVSTTRITAYNERLKFGVVQAHRTYTNHIITDVGKVCRGLSYIPRRVICYTRSTASSTNSVGLQCALQMTTM